MIKLGANGAIAPAGQTIKIATKEKPKPESVEERNPFKQLRRQRRDKDGKVIPDPDSQSDGEAPMPEPRPRAAIQSSPAQSAPRGLLAVNGSRGAERETGSSRGNQERGHRNRNGANERDDSQLPCKDFLRGRCDRQHCRYSHEIKDSPADTDTGPNTGQRKLFMRPNGERQRGPAGPSVGDVKVLKHGSSEADAMGVATLSAAPVPARVAPSLLPSTRPPPTPVPVVKLMNEQFELNTEAASKLLSDSTDFFVIGVVGPQGAGKSTVASELCSHVAYPTLRRERAFHMASRESSFDSRHDTVGIDLGVTTDRLIVLDCQAILSPSILAHIIQHDLKLHHMPQDFVTAENALDIHSFGLLMFLHRVCNVVLYVLDGSALNSTTILAHLDMLKAVRASQHQVPPVSFGSTGSTQNSSSKGTKQPPAADGSAAQSTSAAQATDAAAALTLSSLASHPSDMRQYLRHPMRHTAETLLIFNRVEQQFFTTHFQQRTRSFLEGYFADHQPSTSSGRSKSGRAASGAQPMQKPETGAISSSPVRFYFLPHQFLDQHHFESSTEADTPEIAAESEPLSPTGGQTPSQAFPREDAKALYNQACVRFIEYLQRLTSSTEQSRFPSGLTEKEWLQNLVHVWKLIRFSPVVSEYNRTLQKLQLYSR
eukprot:TRINITY_DN11965_c0_g1_i1.p1 TRINITY_DN11965_c0_g1~~TRINITY_DN11965_c0_g1_i1.p1  ORF type:complete len:655 (-),score=102.03 TRINITY_DN11965_c0_g1_i1:252-2216(-)